MQKLQSGWKHNGVGALPDPGGSWGPAPAKIFFKSYSFQEILRKNPYFEYILGSGPPGVKTPLSPRLPKSWIRPCGVEEIWMPEL